MGSRQIETVLFDCDGVVIDSASLQQAAEKATVPLFAAKFGLDCDPSAIDWPKLSGKSRKAIAAEIFGIPIDSDEADKFRLAVVDTTVEMIGNESTPPLVEGVEEFMSYMALRGLPFGMATSSNRAILTAYQRVHPILVDRFRPGYVVAHGECVDDKPKPGPYMELMKRMGVVDSRTAIIEDSRGGIAAAYEAGGIAIGIVPPDAKDPDAYHHYLQTKTKAHFVARDYPHLIRLLDRENLIH
jgi:beta-phosphoglucomutase-like phosphatase (HAD superfamily)